MQPARINILIACFAYGGNGGTSSIIPEIAIWLTKTYYQMKQDTRIDKVAIKVYSDTPITLTRNRAIRDALGLGYDMILMLDSDNEPDAYLNHDPSAKPFWESSFQFAYERLMQGLPTVVAAPYCGPPPNPCPPPGVTDLGEVPYLFQWTNNESDAPDCQFKIDILTRLEAARLKGMYPVAALPTGVCLFTLNCFEGMKRPIFRYEMNEDGSEKKSTEDVVATRDISLFWMMSKGITAIWANCDAWAFHHKPKKVGRPNLVMLEAIGEEMREAILTQRSARDSIQYVDFTKGNIPEGEIKPLVHQQPELDVSRLPRRGDILRHDQDHVYLTDEDLEHARLLLEMEEKQELERQQAQRCQAAVEAAEATGTLWEDKQPQPDPDYGVVTGTNDGRQLFNDKGHIAVSPNGNALKYRMIGNRKVAAIGSEISDQDIEHIQGLTEWLAGGDDAHALEVVVAHAGSGQSAAAILSLLIEGSHLYALDSVNTYKFSSEPADQFSKSFQPEIDSGRVMADLYSRRFPWPEHQNHLDMVFVERSATAPKLQQLYEHVRSGGILAGLGYCEGRVRKVVDQFAEAQDLRLKAMGGVWAILK